MLYIESTAVYLFIFVVLNEQTLVYIVQVVVPIFNSSISGRREHILSKSLTMCSSSFGVSTYYFLFSFSFLLSEFFFTGNYVKHFFCRFYNFKSVAICMFAGDRLTVSKTKVSEVSLIGICIIRLAPVLQPVLWWPWETFVLCLCPRSHRRGACHKYWR